MKSKGEVISRDGTLIAYEQCGEGFPVILVSGALSTGASEAPLAALLGVRFAAVTYDRRGRGASGDTLPYAVAREVEDIAALIDAMGGSAALYGMSSGGALALEAAASGLPVTRVAVYEPPFTLDEEGTPARKADAARLRNLLAADRRADAAEHFLVGTGMPEKMISGMRQSPLWRGVEALAPTIAYDYAVLGDSLVPVDRLESVRVPVLVVSGGAGADWMANAGRAAAAAVRDGQHLKLEGQTHMVDSAALAPVLAAFFSEPPAERLIG